jgi:hypothetical protein
MRKDKYLAPEGITIESNMMANLGSILRPEPSDFCGAGDEPQGLAFLR